MGMCIINHHGKPEQQEIETRRIQSSKPQVQKKSPWVKKEGPQEYKHTSGDSRRENLIESSKKIGTVISLQAIGYQQRKIKFLLKSFSQPRKSQGPYLALKRPSRISSNFHPITTKIQKAYILAVGNITYEMDTAYKYFLTNQFMKGIGKTTKHILLEGEWSNSQASGIGVFYCVDGSYYDGEWKNDQQDGFGIQRQKGSTYSGMFKQGSQQGKGVLAYDNGDRYEGEFRNNQISGLGSKIYSDGRKYQGEFKNNLMHGFGCYTWPDGKQYQGQFVEDKKHGKGELLWPDGSKYVGFFVNEKQDGQGKFTNQQGKLITQNWIEGMLIDATFTL